MNNQEIMFQCLRAAMPSISKYTDAMILSRVSPKKATDATEDFSCVMESMRITKQNERLVAGPIALKYLINFMRDDVGMPVTIKTIFDSMSMMPSALDNLMKDLPLDLRGQLLLLETTN